MSATAAFNTSLVSIISSPRLCAFRAIGQYTLVAHTSTSEGRAADSTVSESAPLSDITPSPSGGMTPSATDLFNVLQETMYETRAGRADFTVRRQSYMSTSDSMPLEDRVKENAAASKAAKFRELAAKAVSKAAARRCDEQILTPVNSVDNVVESTTSAPNNITPSPPSSMTPSVTSASDSGSFEDFEKRNMAVSTAPFSAKVAIESKRHGRIFTSIDNVFDSNAGYENVGLAYSSSPDTASDVVGLTATAPITPSPSGYMSAYDSISLENCKKDNVARFKVELAPKAAVESKRHGRIFTSIGNFFDNTTYYENVGLAYASSTDILSALSNDDAYETTAFWTPHATEAGPFFGDTGTVSNGLSIDDAYETTAFSTHSAMEVGPIFGDMSASTASLDFQDLDDAYEMTAFWTPRPVEAFFGTSASSSFLQQGTAPIVPIPAVIPMSVPMLMVSSPSDGEIYYGKPEDDSSLLTGEAYVLEIRIQAAWERGYRHEAFPRYATLADIQPWVRRIARGRRTELFSYGHPGPHWVQTEERFQEWKKMRFTKGKRAVLHLEESYLPYTMYR